MPSLDAIPESSFYSEMGISAPDPFYSYEQIWPIIKTQYAKMIELNLLFVLMCIPIITIPAAVSGMTNILMKWIRDEPVFFWKDFFIEFRTTYLERLLVWLALIIAPVSLSLYPYLLGLSRGGSIIFILTGVLSYLFLSYFFPITVLVDISVGAAIKNAIILSFVEWKYSLRIIITAGIMLIACLYYPIFVLLLLVIGLFVLFQLMICVWTSEPIEKWLIADL